MTRNIRLGMLAMCLLITAQRAMGADEAVAMAEDFEASWDESRWQFSDGGEFPGAQGAFGRSADAAHEGQYGGRLQFDFRGGGQYVGAYLQLANAPDVAALRLWIRKPRGNTLTVRYTDQSGQTLQKGVWVPDERWVQLLVPFTGWTGHWGGADNGQIQGPPKQIGVLVENSGETTGAVCWDQLQLVAGRPTDRAGMQTTEYVAARFAPEEGWRLQMAGNGGGTKLEGRRLHFDFSRGAKSIGIVPPDSSLLGSPTQIRIRTQGVVAGHSVRLLMATHFMTFEKTIGEFGSSDASEIVVDAPPGDGWRWYGGENDGQRHGPLRIRGIFLDADGRQDAGTLELRDIQVTTRCAANRCCVMTACSRSSSDASVEFVAEIRSLLPDTSAGTLTCTVRDWSGTIVHQEAKAIPVAGKGLATPWSTQVPMAGRPFLEAEFVLELGDQLVPAAQAYYTAPIPAQEHSPADPASPWGMGLYLYRFGNDPQSLQTMDRLARMGSDAGVKWTREEFGWARIETAEGVYDWSFYDKMVETARRHGISIYGLLAYWSPWTEPYTERGIEDYCRFAAAAATRYRGVIQHWEVYNEPNIFFWQGPRDMYAQLLKKAYTAIKEANPDAQVLGCSTAGIDTKFIKRTMELGAPFDALTIHPYRKALDDASFIRELRETAEIARRSDGTLRPVWITEMGWGTHSHDHGEQAGFSVTTQREQACLLARTYLDAIASGVVANTCWYDFRNDGDDPFNFEFNMGIVTHDFVPKPAYRAYATLARLLAGKSLDSQLDLDTDVTAYRFAGKDAAESVIVVWSSLNGTTVALPCAGPVTVVNLMDERQTVEPVDGKINLSLQRDAPLLVWQQAK